MKLVVGAKDGKSYQTELDKAKEAMLLGKKIGEEVDGGILGLPGYKLKLTGGSDKDGFPMRKDIPGSKRIKALIGSGSGVRHTRKGEKRKKAVNGNTFSQSIVQVNAKVLADGAKPLSELIVMPAKEAKDKK